jgi:hypothetical protein
MISELSEDSGSFNEVSEAAGSFNEDSEDPGSFNDLPKHSENFKKNPSINQHKKPPQQTQSPSNHPLLTLPSSDSTNKSFSITKRSTKTNEFSFTLLMSLINSSHIS